MTSVFENRSKIRMMLFRKQLRFPDLCEWIVSSFYMAHVVFKLFIRKKPVVMHLKLTEWIFGLEEEKQVDRSVDQVGGFRVKAN